ncbi:MULTISPECIES: glycosyltransferase family 4 protein [unclassified Rhodococcus (in: high G+C Gram-positive bacteria)]|uniref:glycosyltransferase family 4 protein n=1 Tax=unclassified Rhodococcus (in: high G+C Gram-positive bacteria) TaxID=192944 RepID=UPI00146F30BE|nr:MULTISPECIES: glycosyltransferase family 4 protein [unclassified Rhodococcus (in: high G+C Gram-positive bacteria)]MBF0662645.1 glycosyltransferase family 4 protein [Rhodococcus sp. (in: high G+C Gram-positive bacteria)]NMD94316.1 glycosyltransferase family 4 protein [Rhodococcus sp. BL-253-APC-6A1W]NME78528.1 glycosyltransferase family 4 protein [Rhodococcus sp. 105337]
MKILIVSWEYPPVVVGGLGRHVHHLATELAAAGNEVVVLSRRPTGTDASTHPTLSHIAEGVLVVAVAEDAPHFVFGEDMLAWTLAMGHAMVRAGIGLSRGGIGEGWQPDVVHAHDWLVAHPAIALAEHFDVPLVSTLHATEAGRHSGWLSGRINRQVHSVEWWLAHESDALITCSASMYDEVTALYGPDLPRISVIRNGIDITTWSYRERAPRSGPARLLYVGRLEYEKGVQDAIAALPRIRRFHPGTTLMVAGDGTQSEWLREQARVHRVARSVTFLGNLDHTELLDRLHTADAIVLPSRYEPFGIIALEAAAAGTPLVTSTAGGLGEAVVDGTTGLSFPPGDVAALTSAVRRTLDDPAAAQERARAARARLTDDFDWGQVAEETAQVYIGAKRRVRHPLGRPVIPQRPLPGRD